MNEVTILRKALERVTANGFEWYTIRSADGILENFVNVEGGLLRKAYFEIIFSQDFASAFFGIREVLQGSGKTYDEYYSATRKSSTMKDSTIIGDWSYWRKEGSVVPEWKYHLARMVLEEHPIRYLEEYL